MASVTTVDHGGGVLEVRLDEPERFNTLEAVIVQELHDVLSGLAPRTDVRVLVLTGAGKHFCAGAHLGGHGAAPGGDGSRTIPDWMSVQEHIATLVTRLRSLRMPVVAAVQGAASGGGFALALASDVRVCADDARFNAAFVKVGLSACDIGVSWLLPRLIGASRAFELLLTGRFVEAEEADRIGLVSRQVPRAELLDTALEVARAIAAHSPYGVRMTKQVMWSQLEISSQVAGLDLENRTQVSAAVTADHREAVAAFLDKRDPVFQNR
ncbi:enoyl-CoA hydratase/isomerase family protein [Streptomyces brasiliensis]|uniref:Enoyl-CoA hydratase/isomerase n=1 Tax=Streptomyces brasiliensis TaxID=1954 RepID=A0A917L528_9ACTN|nr:enoyl-CoA hydratase-related protein [Streptomyces brasiliensis]GGJ40923.1 putative enoyl-CoA hydratase/isomerase [Streptomyces brasiliensis]